MREPLGPGPFAIHPSCEHMATPMEKITQDVVELSRRERLTLMRLLEIRARVKAVDEGRVSSTTQFMTK
jgi:hypothetical protein